MPEFQPRRISKPWGHELWWAQTSSYLAKILVIEKGGRLSLQFHRRKRETVFVLRGRLLLECEGRTKQSGPGQAFDIRPGQTHRFAAPHGRVTLLEASTPEAHDIVRIADDYGRTMGAAPLAAASR